MFKKMKRKLTLALVGILSVTGLTLGTALPAEAWTIYHYVPCAPGYDPFAQTTHNNTGYNLMIRAWNVDTGALISSVEHVYGVHNWASLQVKSVDRVRFSFYGANTMFNYSYRCMQIGL